jgi:hypothetical protein
MDEVEYFAQEQWGQDFDTLTKELIALNECRNLDCWPLGSFGRKDADLDPEGCTGIRCILALDEEFVTLKIGGHKTFCPFTDDEDEFTEDELESIEEQEQFIINDIRYPGYWSGDDWTLDTEDEIRVGWVYNTEELTIDHKKTAENIVVVAKEKLAYFENCMAEYNKIFESIKPEKMDDEEDEF